MKNSDGYLPIEKVECYSGAKIRVLGIVSEVRDQGGLLFADIQEGNNLIQGLFIPDNENAYAMAKNILPGYLVEITGVVKECPMSVPSEDVRKIEIEVERMAIISARSEDENKARKILGRISPAGKRKKKII